MRNWVCWLSGVGCILSERSSVKLRGGVFGGIFITSLVILFSVACRGGTISVVPDGTGDYTTIQEGINAADPNDTIVVGPGVYKENIDFPEWAIWVRSSDPSDWGVVEGTVIDGDFSGSCVKFVNCEVGDSILEGFTLTNGTGEYIDSYPAGGLLFTGQTGGAVYCESSSPIIRGCNITLNGYGNVERDSVEVILGGGVAIVGDSEAVIDNCIVSDSIAYRYGAGILVLGTENSNVSIESCTVVNNRISFNPNGMRTFQCYDIDCWGAGTSVNNTIIWSEDNRSLHITESAQVVHCCVQSVYLFESNYYAEFPTDIGKDGRNIYGSPGFVSFSKALAGGAPGDYRLKPDSICVDRGDPDFDGTGKKDIDGQMRVMGRAVDIGADEVMPRIALERPLAGEVLAAGSSRFVEWDNSHWRNVYVCNGDFEESALSIYFPRSVGEDGEIPGWDIGASSRAVKYEFDYYPMPNGRITGSDRDSGFYQGLGDVYLPDTTYTLRVDIGSMKGDPVTEWLVALTVDDRDTIVVQVDQTVLGNPEEGKWLEASVSYMTGAEGVDPLVGRKIGVLLFSPLKAFYDNVEIDVYEGNPETLDISFSSDGGVNWDVVADGVADRGSYLWDVPGAVDSNDCLLKIEPSVVGGPIEYVGFDDGFAIKSNAADEAVDSVWSTLGGNSRRSGLSELSGPGYGCLKWRFDLDGEVNASAVVGADGNVHIVSEDGKINTVDSDGVLLWSFDVGSVVVSSPSVGMDGTVYLGCEDGRFWAVDKDGEVRWSYSTGQMVTTSAAVDSMGRVFFGSVDGKLYALGADGSELWSFEVPGSKRIGNAVVASPTIGIDGSVYVGGYGSSVLYALDAETGEVNWTCDFEHVDDPRLPFGVRYVISGLFVSSPVVGVDGTIYVTLFYDMNLYAVDPVDGQILWSLDMTDPTSGWFGEEFEVFYTYFTGHRGNSCWSAPVLGPDGTIYVSFDDPYIRAVSAAGEIEWVERFGISDGFTMSVGADGLIYAASDDGSIYVADSGGEEVGRLNSDEMMSYPVAGENGDLYVSSAEGGLLAISREECEGERPYLSWAGDLSGDGKVNLGDLAIILEDWGGCTNRNWYGSPLPYCDYFGWDITLEGDVDRDRYVGLEDLMIMAEQWLNEVGDSQSAKEQL